MDLAAKHALLVSLTTAITGGVFLTILARWMKLPAIILLLAGGVALGPEGIGLVQPGSLDEVLPVIVSLAVGLILFEGGLTLDLRDYARGSKAITQLLTIGVLVTWLGTALAIWLIFETDPSFAVLAGSLVIVTGPTVIGPLLKKIKIVPRLHTILHWEGVVIDAIGVFIAVLCIEWVVGGNREMAVAKLGLRVVSGVAIGALGGMAIVAAFRRRLVPDNLVNAFVLASATLIFGITESVISEAGLLAVTLAGLTVGWFQPVELKAIQKFKAEITDLLIGMLFLLLAPRLRFEQFHDFGAQGVALVACVMFLIRPLNVWLSTWGSPLTVREKLFLSWVAPRGIVAASMASLFAIALSAADVGVDARFLETFTYSVIVATVVLQGFTAGPLAKLLGLQRPDPTGWLIVNADAFSRSLAQFITKEGKVDVLILDTNARLVAEAAKANLPALCEDALNADLAEERIEFQKVGHLLALTDNSELNELLCRRWSDFMGADDVFRWSATRLHPSAAAPGRQQIAFPKMARPSVIAAELSGGDARTETITVGRDAPVLDGLPLLAVRGGVVVPYTGDPGFAARLRPNDKVLLLRRCAEFLARGFDGVVDLQAATLSELYDQLIEITVQRHPSVSKEETLRQLAAQGSIPATLGHGIAIPHVYSPGLASRSILLARLPDCLSLPDQPDPLRLVFFVVSPAGDPEGHLATLAEIARFCADAAQRQALLRAASPEEAANFLRG